MNAFQKSAASIADIHQELGLRLEEMVQTQMTAYPLHWSEADRREMAERDIFKGDEK